MKKTMIVIGTAALLLLGATGVYAATTYKTPAEIYADLTGKTTEQAYEERAAGVPYGVMADEAGVYDEFQKEMLENRKEIIEQRVKDGTLTQEQADLIIANMEANIGSGYCPGPGYGAGAGYGGGYGMGRGAGVGYGRGGCGYYYGN